MFFEEGSKDLDTRKFAVKKYNISQSKTHLEKDMILCEIGFLRELKLCDNIVQLESVYT